jgi:hypothetical protein
MKELLLLNGRWGWNTRQYIYIAAKNKTDAARLMLQANEGRGTVGAMLYEINNYFSVGCWGNSMKDITPERGVWIAEDNYGSIPERVI